MWHALRAELAYFRPWLLGGLAIAAGVILILEVVLFAVGTDAPRDSLGFLRGFFPMIAGMAVGFIAQGYRSEERRARLLLAGPLSPRHLAGVLVLLPAILFGIGAAFSGLVLVSESLVTGSFYFESLHKLLGIGGQLFAIVMMGPLAQESSTARRQGRTGASITGWALFVVGILLLGLCQLRMGTAAGYLGEMAVGVLVAIPAWVLYQGRTDFTR